MKTESISENEKKGRDNGVKWKNESLPATERVQDWLSREGWPLEFEIAVEFTRAGFDVTQGIHQQQPDGKPLEIDVLAQAKRGWAPLSYDVLVECKTTKQPWVAFAPLWAGDLPTPPAIETASTRAATYLTYRTGDRVPDIWPKSPIAFDMKCLRSGGDKDLAYEALLGIVARARLRLARIERAERNVSQLPVVVVDGELCMASWAGQGKSLDIVPTNACIVEFRGDSVIPAVRVQVLTKSAVAGWLPEFTQHMERRTKLVEQYVDQVESTLRIGVLRSLNLDKESLVEAEILKSLEATLVARRR